MDSNKIRAIFLDFFRSKGHTIVPSAPMVVKNDPTLMFTNAGMNQFKDMFLGNCAITTTRIADSQKCLRVSGKHNDLDEVGHDTYHHTMFEMLGNWSFGDYFKKEAIDWAWELLVDVYGLPKERIYATVFEGAPEEGVEKDNEAYNQWRKYLPEDQILMGNKKDNFWEMGDTGPCGPCSEVHFDLRDESEIAKLSGRELVNKSHHLVIEIWNLVFIQYNRKANGSLEALPNKHVDTGMGFERLCMVLQGKKSNYDTDVFQPIIQRLAQMSGKVYGQNQADDIAMRVVADHLRAISFAIADGQLPSNVKAGYVIRRILRRGVRYGYTYLGFSEPFINSLVQTLVDQLGTQFPELKAQQTLIEKVIFEEEASFLRTLSTGISLLDGVISKCDGKMISGDEAFLLYDTYGFPIDLTELIAREHGMSVDIESFNKNLAAQKERSRGAGIVENDDWIEVKQVINSAFVGYDTLEIDTYIARYRRVSAKGKTFFQVVLEQTPFYGNSGGQVGDMGYLLSDGEKYPVLDTQKDNNLTIHILNELPENVSERVVAVVNGEKRRESANNHSATHLMQLALREVLGTHVEQKGSMVAPTGLRFDFSHFQKVTTEELKEVERMVNRMIRANYPIDEHRDCDFEQAKDMGAMMLFGEKYGDKVRVVKFGDSIEFCGGTHVSATGQIGLFKIVSESAISAGVRRIEAITGAQTEEYVDKLESILKDIQLFLGSPTVIPAIKKLVETNSELSKQVEENHKQRIQEIVNEIVKEVNPNDDVFIVARQLDVLPDMVKNIAFALKNTLPNIVMIIGSVMNEKVNLSVMLGEQIVAKGLDAGKIVREAAKLIDGGGGGQAFFATAGGKKPAGVEAAILMAKELIIKQIEEKK